MPHPLSAQVRLGRTEQGTGRNRIVRALEEPEEPRLGLPPRREPGIHDARDASHHPAVTPREKPSHTTRAERGVVSE